MWWGFILLIFYSGGVAGVVICLERGADLQLHTAQLMPLPLIVSCSSKIQIGFTYSIFFVIAIFFIYFAQDKKTVKF